MNLSLDVVEQIAHLARLDLNDVQKATYQEQLSAILEYAELLNELALDDVEPTTRAVPMRNVWRDDVVEGTLPTSSALAGSDHVSADQFVVQAVLDE